LPLGPSESPIQWVPELKAAYLNGCVVKRLRILHIKWLYIFYKIQFKNSKSLLLEIIFHYGCEVQSVKRLAMECWFPAHIDQFWGSSTSCSVGTWGSFPQSKEVRAQNWPLTPSNAEVRNVWSFTSTSPACLCSVMLRHRNNFTLFLHGS